VIVDFFTDDNVAYDADLCIIGGGIAAYTLLSALSDTSMRVIVVERGGMKPGPDQESEKACHVSGHSFTGHLEGRYFGLGGTSEYWGGQALPLEEFDLTKKEWIDFSGWPISLEEISPYYPDAEKLFQVDPIAYSTDVFELRSLAPLPWNQSTIKLHFSKWSPRPNFKPNLLDAYSSAARTSILLNAVVSSLEFDANNKEVTHIQIQSHSGKRGTIKATAFVLAAGGIENARILQVSSTLPGNKWIGRMFQDHPTAQVATIHPTDMHSLQRYFGYFFKGRTRCLPRLSLTAEAQREKRMLAATAFIQFLPKEGSLFEAMKPVYRELSRLKFPSYSNIKTLFGALRKIGEVFPMLKAYWGGGYIYVPNSIPRLTIMLEQSPDVDSYVGLSSALDRYGMQVSDIHWQIPDTTIDTLKEFCAMLENEFSRLSLGHIEWDPWINQDNKTIKAHLIDAYHHMGTTRMSTSDASGVVDENCRMHGTGNVYVAGSSVFPTSGHSNPTLTFMALALRLGQHLKLQFNS
jgi:hypothetical protein